LRRPSAAVSKPTDAVGGRYHVGSGGLETCGSWVVAVGGVEEMLVTAAVGHRPHRPPSPGRRWPGLLLVVAAEKNFSKKLPDRVDNPRFRGVAVGGL
jgi:hypothetical protein